MEFIVASLATYKVVQLLDALVPREVMPWVKILVGIALGYVASLILSLDGLPVMGLAVAAGAGILHTVLRLTTLVGDVARKRSAR